MSRSILLLACLLPACEPVDSKPDYLPPDLRLAEPLSVARPAGHLETGAPLEEDLCADARLYDAFLFHAFAGSEWAVDVETRKGLDPVVMV